MFLKTQEDLQKLLSDFPLSDYSIRIQEGKHDFAKHRTYLNITHENDKIYSKNNKVYLIDNIYKNSALKVNDYGLSDNEIEIGKYEYDKKGIQVIGIFKKTKISEGIAGEIPIMLNGDWIVKPDFDEIQRTKKLHSVQEFYDEIAKFFYMCTFLKDELRMVKRIEYDDNLNNESILRTNKDLRIFRFYFQQSLSDYFALWYRKLIDNDTRDQRNFNFKMILKNGKDIGLIKKDTISKIELEFEKFTNPQNIIVKHVNKLVAHMDKDKFKEYYNIRRTSETGIEVTKYTTNPEKIFEELSKLIDFMDKTINENFTPEIRFGHGGGHSQTRFTLKLISNN